MAKRRSYYDALSEALEKPDAAFCATWTQRQCEEGIAEITENLKRPMTNGERIAACADRKALRERLAGLVGNPN